jgi:hypothetical protein
MNASVFVAVLFIESASFACRSKNERRAIPEFCIFKSLRELPFGKAESSAGRIKEARLGRKMIFVCGVFGSEHDGVHGDGPFI